MLATVLHQVFGCKNSVNVVDSIKVNKKTFDMKKK